MGLGLLECSLYYNLTAASYTEGISCFKVRNSSFSLYCDQGLATTPIPLQSTVLFNSKASGKPKQKTRHPVTSAYIQFCVVAAHKQIHSCAVSRKSFSVNALMLLQELFSATSRPSAINKLRQRELTAAERRDWSFDDQQQIEGRKLITYIQNWFRGSEHHRKWNQCFPEVYAKEKTTHPGGFNFTRKAWDTENRKLVKGSCMLEPFTDSLRWVWQPRLNAASNVLRRMGKSVHLCLVQSTRNHAFKISHWFHILWGKSLSHFWILRFW